MSGYLMEPNGENEDFKGVLGKVIFLGNILESDCQRRRIFLRNLFKVIWVTWELIRDNEDFKKARRNVNCPSEKTSER